VKLFSVQRKENTKLLQFVKVMKAMFDCGGNSISGIMKEILWMKERLIS
jgi:hypothetical protein